MKTNNNNIPKEIIELLPWYAIGCLSDEEHNTFQTALLKYPDLQSKLDQEREMITIISENHDLLEESALIPSAQRLESVLNRLEAQNLEEVSESQQSNVKNSNGIKDFFTNLIPNNFGTLHYASIAVAVFAAAIFFALVEPIFNNQDNTFVPAAAKISDSQSQHTVILVRVNGDSEDLKKIPALSNFYSKIEPVSGNKGMYQIKLNKKLNAEQVKKLISDLQTQTELIRFAGEEF